ncbi:MAG: hypothetical protein ACYC5F_10970 [Thermoleophilia bacterium]
MTVFVLALLALIAGTVVIGQWFLVLNRIRQMPEEDWPVLLSRASARSSWALIVVLAIEMTAGFWSGNIGRPSMTRFELAVGVTVFGLAFLLSALSIRGAFAWSEHRLRDRWREGHRW